MNDVTRILSAIEQGDPLAPDQLLPLVYQELRKLAAQKLAKEKPGQTLDATALVHEAYLRLVASPGLASPGRTGPKWNSRGHFFAAAAESIRRILVEQARRKKRMRHGGGMQRVNLDEALTIGKSANPELLDLDDALHGLEAEDSLAANLVKLRYFSGLTMPQAAEALGISLRNAERNWTYARTWLHRALVRLRDSRSDHTNS
jgi:RNA polymerase sigma factor (TIGR02999 family)